MTIKMLGAEFKRFYADPIVWAPDTFHDDVLIRVDGVNAIEAEIDLSTVSDTAMIEIESGEILDGLPGVPEDLADAALWWRARQTSADYVVSVPHAQKEAFEAALASVGLRAFVIGEEKKQ